ncbi:MAG: SMC-Scp complex subunit ScpB [Methylacidiphilales bacterium]|nr:SMC-Scp complex subunit ScpB [Candidatus Methylacidiphilales bacterium]MDW8348940.1 SMC-Scp complex subunit ScpB [Verrucomicrobiae bacterium]
MNPSETSNLKGIRLEQVIEALIFAATRAISVKELFKIIQEVRAEGSDSVQEEVTEEVIMAKVKELQTRYDIEERAFRIYEVNGGYRFGTRVEFAPWIEKIFEEKPAKLSPAALETLAVIAYRQPISRAEIESIRGVAVDGVIQSLLERKLIKGAGRAALPGRPQLYRTTDEFLEFFGLASLDELPDAHELRRVEKQGVEEQGTDLFEKNVVSCADDEGLTNLRESQQNADVRSKNENGRGRESA